MRPLSCLQTERTGWVGTSSYPIVSLLYTILVGGCFSVFFLFLLLFQFLGLSFLGRLRKLLQCRDQNGSF